MKTAKLAKSYRIDNGKHFRLKDFDPADTGHWQSAEEAKEQLQQDIARMEDLQDKLYAQDCWSVLLISRLWTPPAKTAPSSTSCRA